MVCNNIVSIKFISVIFSFSITFFFVMLCVVGEEGGDVLVVAVLVLTEITLARRAVGNKLLSFSRNIYN